VFIGSLTGEYARFSIDLFGNTDLGMHVVTG
jgi:hypothetical protein